MITQLRQRKKDLGQKIGRGLFFSKVTAKICYEEDGKYLAISCFREKRRDVLIDDKFG